MTSQQHHDVTDDSKTFVELTTVQCDPNLVSSTPQKCESGGVDRWLGTAIYWPPSQAELSYTTHYDTSTQQGQEALQYLQYRNSHWDPQGHPTSAASYAQQPTYNNTYHWPTQQDVYGQLPQASYYDNQSHYDYMSVPHMDQNPAQRNYEIPISKWH